MKKTSKKLIGVDALKEFARENAVVAGERKMEIGKMSASGASDKNYGKSEVDHVEKHCLDILKTVYLLDIKKNNDGDKKTEPDYVVNLGQQKYFADAQFKRHFDGKTLALDIVSAFDTKGEWPEKWNKKIKEIAANSDPKQPFLTFLGKNFEKFKPGKIFSRSSRIEMIMHMVYSGENVLDVPDALFFVRAKDVEKYLNENWHRLTMDGRFNVNLKRQIGNRDVHGSAYIKAPVEELITRGAAFLLPTHRENIKNFFDLSVEYVPHNEKDDRKKSSFHDDVLKNDQGQERD